MRSTVKTDTRVEKTLMRPVMTADIREASAPNPRVLRAGRVTSPPADHERHDELRAVAPAHQGRPRVLHGLGRLASLHQVLELRGDVIGAPHASQHGPGLVLVAPVDERVGGVREEEGPHRHDQRRHHGQASPRASPAPLDLPIP
ncbi:hypothetical protein ACMD2_19195 [Ananas comosus]|uniref:Uncharacterized protein n=1 Tax=Ananas comosus TaxID=4615 RepID=A0A199V9N1_ANACO|nr:hypothetical protein ACMD2_19195 [Ananas comosus]